MLEPKKVVRFQLSGFLLPFLASLCLIGLTWMACIAISQAGYPFPAVSDKFYELGFFSISTLSFIIFLTMIPLQNVEARLSPGFYSRMVRDPWSHFGLYILIISSIMSFLVLAAPHIRLLQTNLNELFVALVFSEVCAILFYRFWVLCYLYRPYVIYKNIEKLADEESLEDLWLELLECTHKAIKDTRISDARNLIRFLGYIHQKYGQNQKYPFLKEDLQNLYEKTQEFRAVARYFEIKWPFLIT